MNRRAGEIPEDVLFEILIRLPVRSLCKFRVVSTSWLRIISDPNFIRSNFDVAKNGTRLLLMDSIQRPAGPTWGCLVYDADHSKLVEAVKVPNSPYSRYFPSPSVHGLICLDRGENHIGILNPSTQEFISISLPQLPGIGSPYDKYPYICFGFDSLANKHKVLYSYGAPDPQLQPKRVTEHWLFTLGRGEKWRRVGISKRHVKCYSHQEVCIDGVIYFIVREYGAPRYHLICLAAFDLRSESFQMTRLYFPSMGDISDLGLIEFNGAVALVQNHLDYRYRPYVRSVHIGLWVLEDFHKQHWALKRSILVPDAWREIIQRQGLDLACALHGGELLVFKPCERDGPNLDLCFYNLKSNRFWSTRIHAPVGDVFPEGAYCAVLCSDHVESLLPLKAPP